MSMATQAVCEMCEDGAVATCKCMDCDQVCCESCAQSHARIKATRSHTVVTVSQTVSPPEKMCETHKGEKLRFYCMACKLVICRDCKLTQHEGHGTSDISQVSGNAKTALQKVMPLLQTHLRPCLKVILQEAVQHRSGVLQKKKEILSTLRERANLLKAEIDTCLAAAEKQLSLQSGGVEVAVDTSIKEMTQELATLDDLVDRAKCVLNSGGHADLLQVPKQIGEFVSRNQDVQTTQSVVITPTSGFRPRKSKLKQFQPEPVQNPLSSLRVFTNNEWGLDLQLTNLSRQQGGFMLGTSSAQYPGNNAVNQPFTIPQPLKTQIADCMGTVTKVPPASNPQVRSLFTSNERHEKKSQYESAVVKLVRNATEIERELSEWA